MDEKVDHCVHKGSYESPYCLIVVWDFGQRILSNKFDMFIISAHTTHIIGCVLAVKLH
jgi:hypothetical protein